MWGLKSYFTGPEEENSVLASTEATRGQHNTEHSGIGCLNKHNSNETKTCLTLLPPFDLIVQGMNYREVFYYWVNVEITTIIDVFGHLIRKKQSLVTVEQP